MTDRLPDIRARAGAATRDDVAWLVREIERLRTAAGAAPPREPAIIGPVKRPKLKRDWVGRQVRTKRVMRNGNVSFPAGTVCTVTYNRAGLSLETEPCGACGVRIYITKVGELDVELLPADVEIAATSVADQAAFVYNACYSSIVVTPVDGDQWQVNDGAGGPLMATVPVAVLEYLDANYDMPVVTIDDAPFIS